MQFRIFATNVLWFVLFVVPASAQRQPLVDDDSRDDLAIYALSLEGPTRVYPLLFKFPDDVRKAQVFGIDVSHYNGDIDWDRVVDQNVSFAFIKATQGKNLYDGKFSANWNGLQNAIQKGAVLRRGAYHFMTSTDPPDLQAENFLRTVGKLTTSDLPPCLDLEWDLVRQNQGALQNTKVDQWASLTPAQIIQRVTVWLKSVEAATHKRPIIYTNAQWWSQRIGTDLSFLDYPMWIADYSSKSLGREYPVVPQSYTWRLWQLTDQGVLTKGGVNKSIDTSVYNGSPDDLEKQLYHRKDDH